MLGIFVIYYNFFFIYFTWNQFHYISFFLQCCYFKHHFEFFFFMYNVIEITISNPDLNPYLYLYLYIYYHLITKTLVDLIDYKLNKVFYNNYFEYFFIFFFSFFYIYGIDIKYKNIVYKDYFNLYYKYIKFFIFFKFFILSYKLKILNLLYIYILKILLILDFFLYEDEPFFEPSDISLLQVYLLYLFLFSWIYDNIIKSRFGYFTGHDKILFIGLFKTYWFMKLFFILNLTIIFIFLYLTFFYELNYSLSNFFYFWDYLSLYYFFKISSIYIYILIICNVILIANRWLNWKFQFILSLVILILLFFIFYFLFINLFLSFFSDKNRFDKINWLDYFSISKGPKKWGFGDKKFYIRKLFNHHDCNYSYWFKNNFFMSSFFFLFNFFFLFFMFILIIKWVFFIKYIYLNKDISYTFLTFIIYNIKQFYLLLLSLSILSLSSFLVIYFRSPADLYFFQDLYNFLLYFIKIIKKWF